MMVRAAAFAPSGHTIIDAALGGFRETRKAAGFRSSVGTDTARSG
jgi:hypothetical protein